MAEQNFEFNGISAENSPQTYAKLLVESYYKLFPTDGKDLAVKSAINDVCNTMELMRLIRNHVSDRYFIYFGKVLDNLKKM